MPSRPLLSLSVFCPRHLAGMSMQERIDRDAKAPNNLLSFSPIESLLTVSTTDIVHELDTYHGPSSLHQVNEPPPLLQTEAQVVQSVPSPDCLSAQPKHEVQ